MNQDSNKLIFRWERQKNPVGRLLPFVLLALVGQFFVFYFIRIVNPPVERWTPSQSEIVLLSSSDERALPLLRALEDRAILLDETSADDDEYFPYVQGASFRPSFLQHEIPLRDRPQVPEERRRIDLFETWGVRVPALPPLPQPVIEAANEEEFRKGFLRFGGKLEARKTEADQESLSGWFREQDPLFVRLWVGVSPRGAAQVLSVCEAMEGRLSRTDLEAIRQSLRFAPAEEWTWDWMEIQR